MERASAPVVLPVLEERFPVLLARALHCHPDFASHYQFQPLVVLLEIEQWDTYAAEKAYRSLQTEEKQATAVYAFVSQMDAWRKRLEYACLGRESIRLLKDLSGQIATNISPLFSTFVRLYGRYLKAHPDRIWFVRQKEAKEEGTTEEFPRRFYFLLLSSIRLLQSKCEEYREEICASGRMDPSLALLTAFLHNYSELASSFNVRWQSLPQFYIREILGMSPRKETLGTTWFSFEKSAGGSGRIVPKDTYLEAEAGEEVPGYRLLSDLQLTDMKSERAEMIVAEKNNERYPEAALGYVTAVVRGTVPSDAYTPAPVGLCIHSSMLLLCEGRREVSILFRLTSESLAMMEAAVAKVAAVQEISQDETLFKMLYDAFHLEVSTQDGLRSVDSFRLHWQRGEGLRLTFRLHEDFPALLPAGEDVYPSLRLLMNPAAWLFPYSWAREIVIKSVLLRVTVQGVRRMQIYNELGRVDVGQAFIPFGVSGEKGSWLAFGSYEMACKPVREVGLTVHWQHLPACRGGLKEYYEAYGADIDNRSFRVRIDRLKNREWKPLADTDSVCLFRTSAGSVPEKESRLVDKTEIRFNLSETTTLGWGQADRFQLGEVRSGFYRLVLDAPEMGLGTYEYRRLFAEVMMYNSHARRKRPLPESPLSLLVDAPQLDYSAEEECFFSVGSVPSIHFSYIRPLSAVSGTLPDTAGPIALIDGPEDEGNLMIGIVGAVGENLIRMYLDLELSWQEIDHACLPRTDWYYKDGAKWLSLDPANVLLDNTDGLMHSGAVILQLPFCVTPEMIDAEGLFWISVAVHSYWRNCSAVRGIHLNVAEVVPVSVTEEKRSVPGLLSCCRIAPLTGSRVAEGDLEMRTRMSERISHRRRLLLSHEYEQMTLQEFPEIAKVKCLTGTDAKGQNRHTVVTLAVIACRRSESYPLCTDELLCRIEGRLRLYASPFVDIDAINPVYEEVTVFCGVSLKTGEAAGTAMQEVRQGLRHCIAPWERGRGTPVFGTSFSIRDMQSCVKESGRIATIHGLKLVHVIRDNDGLYSIRQYLSGGEGEQVIAPSVPWAILVPASVQYVKVVNASEWRREVEFGDLEVENTFVIK